MINHCIFIYSLADIRGSCFWIPVSEFKSPEFRFQNPQRDPIAPIQGSRKQKNSAINEEKRATTGRSLQGACAGALARGGCYAAVEHITNLMDK